MKNPVSWLVRNIRETRELDDAVASLYQMLDDNLAQDAQRAGLRDVFSLLDDPNVAESVKERIRRLGLNDIDVAYADTSGNIRVRSLMKGAGSDGER